MRKYIFLIILLSGCTKDKSLTEVVPTPNDLVPIRIGSTWTFHRSVNQGIFGNSENDYSIIADKIVNIDSHEWFHMKFQNTWTYQEHFWRNDEFGFYQMIYDSTFYGKMSSTFYPANRLNDYEIQTTDTGSCKRHDKYDILHQPFLNVKGKLYDSYKYAFDTTYFDNSCTVGNFLLPNSQVIFLSKGYGIVKILENSFPNNYNLINIPDSSFSIKDELTRFKY